jgi:hypothetical protein
VTQAQRSNRVRAFGWAGSKSSIYRDVQAVGEAVERIRQGQGERKVQVIGTDTTFVVCKGRQVTIAIGVDALNQSMLDIELVDSESVENLRPFLTELVRMFDVEVVVSDDM